MVKNYDVVVIGAGPAGSTAAKLAAEAGYHTLLVDKARFPRHKTCASWINRLAFERFPDLEPHRAELVDSAFHGITFLDERLARQARWSERRPSGYLSLRSRFDNGLKDIAVSAGADFREGSGLAALSFENGGVTIRLENGDEFRGRTLIGADGAHSRVAYLSGLRRGWKANEYVLCANEDLPYSAEEIARRYSDRRPLLVALRFDGLVGYGWIFPKRDHLCVGLGGRLGPGERIQDPYRKFFHVCQERHLLPADLAPQKPYYDLDPAGAVNKGGPLVRGPVVLVGDAGGFVSGSTGEGIYPAMETALLAVELIDRGLRRGHLEEELARFQTLWRARLGGYLRDLPGGEHREQTVDRIGLIFRSRLVCGVAARAFLYGEPLTLATLARAVWS
ncbi:MAG: NAD(P)/FAD-dependent oxidoreductase [Acidobacteria bacterium]|nr:NAD(P)/FAD-dependent oxidoreductase [Acidobacteriota bacterium]